MDDAEGSRQSIEFQVSEYQGAFSIQLWKKLCGCVERRTYGAIGGIHITGE